MTQYRITATFLLGRAGDSKHAVRSDVKDALVAELQSKGYVVADGHVEVRVSTPRRRRMGLG